MGISRPLMRPLKRRKCKVNVNNENVHESINTSTQHLTNELENKTASGTDQSKFELTYEQRKERLLLVFTLTAGFLIVVIQILFKFLKNIYNSIYISQDTFWGGYFPLGSEHISLPIIISSLIFILFYVVLYCYKELHSFANESSLTEKHKKDADKAFRTLLDSVKINSLLSVIVIASSTIILSFSNKLNIAQVFIILFLLFLIGYFFVFCYKVTIDHSLESAFLSCCIYFFIAASVYLFYFSYLDGKYNININFDEQSFSSKIVLDCTYFPDNFEIEIKNLNTKSEMKLKLTPNDFEKKYVQVILNNEDPSSRKKTKKILYDKSMYTFVKNINLKDYLTDGKYSFEVKFDNANKTISLYNEIVVTNESISFTDKELSLQD